MRSSSSKHVHSVGVILIIVGIVCAVGLPLLEEFGTRAERRACFDYVGKETNPFSRADKLLNVCARINPNYTTQVIEVIVGIGMGLIGIVVWAMASLRDQEERPIAVSPRRDSGKPGTGLGEKEVDENSRLIPRDIDL